MSVVADGGEGGDIPTKKHAENAVGVNTSLTAEAAENLYWSAAWKK